MMEMLSDNKNLLLNRREIKIIFKDSYGKIKRSEALEAIANFLKLDKNKLFLIKLEGKRGSRDAIALCYYYENLEDAKRQLPKVKRKWSGNTTK